MHKQTDVTMVDSAAYSPKGIGVFHGYQRGKVAAFCT